jgi:hypothetical protein
MPIEAPEGRSRTKRFVRLFRLHAYHSHGASEVK